MVGLSILRNAVNIEQNSYFLFIVGLRRRRELQPWVNARVTLDDEVLGENFDTVYTVGGRFALVWHLEVV